MRLHPLALILVAALCAVLARASEPPSLTDRIAHVLLTAPRHESDRDEPIIDREQRLLAVASAVSAAVQHARCRGSWQGTDCRPVWRGDPLILAAAVLAVGTLESHHAARVQRGECGPHECDRDPQTGQPRALGIWQHWPRSCPEAWQQPPGSDGELRAGATALPAAWPWSRGSARTTGR